MGWWEILAEFLGEGVPTAIGSLLAFGGLGLLGASLFARSPREAAIGAAAFGLGAILLWFSRRGS